MTSFFRRSFLRVLLPILALVGGPPIARAAPLVATLEVARSGETADCPDKGELSGSVERILERPFRDPTEQGSDVRIHVEFSRGANDGYQARLELVGSKSGERFLQDASETCGPLAEAVAVALALFLDRELPDPTPHEPPPPKEPPSPRPKSSFAFLVGVRGGAAFGTTSRIAPALGGRVGVIWRDSWALFGDFDVVLPRATDFEPGSVRISLLRGALEGCYLLGRQVRAGPCAAVAVGRLSGAGAGYDVSSKSHLFYAAAGPGVELQIALSEHWYGGMSGVLWFPTQTYSFLVENAGSAWESPPVQGSVATVWGMKF